MARHDRRGRHDTGACAVSAVCADSPAINGGDKLGCGFALDGAGGLDRAFRNGEHVGGA